MKNDLIAAILDAASCSAVAAGWDCDIDRNQARITFTADIPGSEGYDFRIAFGDETPEELIATISDSIDYETAFASSPDFTRTLLQENNRPGTGNGSAFSYAGTVSAKLQALSERMNAAFDQIDLTQPEVPLEMPVPMTGCRLQKTPAKGDNQQIKTIKPDEWYRTDKNTLLHITASAAPDIPPFFRSVVRGTDKNSISADVLRRCYESDSIYTRKALAEPFRQLIEISVQQNGKSRSASFRKAYGDRAELLSFTLSPRDDVREESLYRLFAGSLERMLLEPQKGQGTEEADAYSEIVKTNRFRLENIVPNDMEQIPGGYICFYIPPEFLSEDTHLLTDEGKKEFQTVHTIDLLYRFMSWAGNRMSFGYEEFSMDGSKLSEKTGFFGSDFRRNGMQEQSGISLVRCLGMHQTIEECILALNTGQPPRSRQCGRDR